MSFSCKLSGFSKLKFKFQKFCCVYMALVLYIYVFRVLTVQYYLLRVYICLFSWDSSFHTWNKFRIIMVRWSSKIKPSRPFEYEIWKVNHYLCIFEFSFHSSWNLALFWPMPSSFDTFFSFSRISSSLLEFILI